jgi:hypothetical protein
MRHRARLAPEPAPCPAAHPGRCPRHVSVWPARATLGLLVLGALGACDGMSGLSGLEFGQWVGAPCNADTDCDSNTYCAPGIHRCEYQQDIGGGCQANNECKNDLCADGVCCETACTGVCESCAAPDSVGTCTPHAAGSDPDDECPGTSVCTGASACVGGNLWAMTFGDEQNQAGAAVAFDSQGNLVIGANFSSTIVVGTETLTAQGDSDILLAKIDPTGQPLWVQAIGGDGSQYLHGLAIDADDRIVIAGDYAAGMQLGGQTLTMTGDAYNGEVFVAQLSDAGTPLWIKNINWLDPADPDHGGGSQATRAVAVDKDGNVAVTGKFSGGVTIGNDTWLWSPGYDDIFLAKLDSQGNFVWSKALLSDVDGPYIESQALAFDGSGNLVLGGSFMTGIDFGPPTGRLDPTYYFDAFLAKYNSDGALAWARKYGAGDEEQLYGLAVDSGGNLVITGFFTGTVSFGGADLTSQGDRDVFVAKLTPTGDHQWSKGFGGLYPQQGNSVAIGPDDAVVVGGSFTLNVSFDPSAEPLMCHGWEDAFLAKLTATGELVWAQPFGGLLDDQGVDVAADVHGGSSAITGSFQDHISFGGESFASAGANDGFVAEFAP